ncbi:hypothetical protein SAMN05446635_9926 [Burkholderia sp. OK233]|nr:hypothetical protein SAMN05446635_9926 [Burkholderia sp. OK233]
MTQTGMRWRIADYNLLLFDVKSCLKIGPRWECRSGRRVSYGAAAKREPAREM